MAVLLPDSASAERRRRAGLAVLSGDPVARAAMRVAMLVAMRVASRVARLAGMLVAMIVTMVEDMMVMLRACGCWP